MPGEEKRPRPARIAPAVTVALAMTALLAGCAVPPPRAGAGSPVTPAAGCAPGTRPIGTLAVLGNTVFRNARPAASGERVCDNDRLSTDATGQFELLVDSDQERDTVHGAQNTDPRFTWARGGCLHIDAYQYGRITVNARRHCMVVRTPDALLLIHTGRVQFQVNRNAFTQVVPLSGSYVKLQGISPQQVQTLPRAELMRYAAPPAQQPQPQARNDYQSGVLVRPAVRLTPGELENIERLGPRRPIPGPAPGPVIR